MSTAGRWIIIFGLVLGLAVVARHSAMRMIRLVAPEVSHRVGKSHRMEPGQTRGRKPHAPAPLRRPVGDGVSVEKSGIVFNITGRTRRGEWTAAASFAALWPRRRIAVYYQYPDFVIRRYSGQVVAEVPCAQCGEATECGVRLAEGDHLFFWLGGPSYGITIYDPSVWPDLLAENREGELDWRAARVRWIKGERCCGRPIWTNGSVYLDIRYGVSPRDVRRAKSGGFLPVYLEERRVKNRHLLWSRRLRGVPPASLRAETRGPHSLLLRFSGGPRWSGDGFRFIRGIPHLSIAVPLLAGSSARGKTLTYSIL